MMGALAYGLEQGMDLPELVRLSSAASVGAVMLPGTDAPGPALIEELAPRLTIQKAVNG